ncbi:TIGR04222 domain-containing membrane protein, partial [Streptomyces anulatus]|uniref:TIGR04222 domain-containing membrane protein n=1 Tax=Streptomyces anulatus TaxID=1892 RepID=UPI00343EC8C4
MGVVLFGVGVVLAVAVWVTAVALRAEHRRVSSAGTGGTAPLGPYELAYLSGGPLRVVNTAIGVLARTGALRVARGGQISLVTGARPPAEAIEHAVLDALGSRGGSCSATELRRTVAEGLVMDGLRYRLLGMGLLVPEDALTEARRLLNRLLALTLISVVFEAGAIFSVASLGYLGMLATLAGSLASLIGLFTYFRMRRTLRGVVSGAGHAALVSARGVHVRGARSMTPDLALAVAFPVALYGLGELGDPVLEEELNRHAQTATAGSSCASGACGGGSSDSSSGGGDFGSGDWG